MSDSTKSLSGPKNVLVVDDTENVAELMREMLMSFGHQAEVCLTVEEALQKFVPDKFDLVITDYTMPQMNGLEFARAIRDRSPNQSILLITGSTQQMNGGAEAMVINATLEKPFSVMEFQNSVETFFTCAPAPTPA